MENNQKRNYFNRIFKDKVFPFECDGIKIEMNKCKECGGPPQINMMAHGERWISCSKAHDTEDKQCTRENSVFKKDDNNPYMALRKVAEDWNKKNPIM